MKSIFLFLIFTIPMLNSCKQEHKETNELLSCFLFSCNNMGCSYFITIDKHGLIEVTHGSCNYEGSRLYFDGENYEPSKYNLLETIGVVDSIYNFKDHKWEFYSYNGFLCAKKQLSQAQLNSIKKFIVILDKKNKKKLRKRICDDKNDVYGIVVVINGGICAFWEDEVNTIEKSFIDEIKEYSPMPLLMKPRPNCLSGEGSPTKSIIEVVENP